MNKARSSSLRKASGGPITPRKISYNLTLIAYWHRNGEVVSY